MTDMSGGWDLPDGYDDPEEMADEELMDELGALSAHHAEDALTDEQDNYYEALRLESLKRMSTSGEHADYTGPEDNDE